MELRGSEQFLFLKTCGFCSLTSEMVVRLCVGRVGQNSVAISLKKHGDYLFQEPTLIILTRPLSEKGGCSYVVGVMDYSEAS